MKLSSGGKWHRLRPSAVKGFHGARIDVGATPAEELVSVPPCPRRRNGVEERVQAVPGRLVHLLRTVGHHDQAVPVAA